MASIDNIVTGQIVTWSKVTSACIEALKNVCCNIDGYASGVPTRLRSGQTKTQVKSLSTSQGPNQGSGHPDSYTPTTHRWYANPSNLITTVTSSTVESEWSTFLSAAGINSRSNKVVQAKEVGLAIGLFQQFMTYHVKRIYSRRQVYNTLESNPGIFQGNKYVTGTITPKYTLSPIEPSSIPTVNNNDITNLINQAIYRPGNNWGILNNNNSTNPSIPRYSLST